MRKIMVRILAVALVLAVSAIEADAADTGPLKIAISNWAPYKDENLPEGGIVTDITKQALIRAGFDIKITVVPWKRALRGAETGKYDVIPAIWKNPEREKFLNFGDPVITSRMVIVSRKDYGFDYKNLESLRGETVGVASGWGYPEDFKTATFFNKKTSNNLTQSLKILIHGRVKLAIVEEFAARYTVNREFKDALGTLTYSKIPLQQNNLHVAFSKKRTGHEDIKKRFNEALAMMKEDGSYQKTLVFHGVHSAIN